MIPEQGTQLQCEDETASPIVSANDNVLQIINLSPYILNQDEISVLQKGLIFSPMKSLDKFIITKDL